MTGAPDDRLLAEQLAYYRERAPEYDDWFFRRGRYDRGPELNARWFAEVEEVRGALRAFAPRGRVLELACGTGLWSEVLHPLADELTVVDAAPEVLDLHRERLPDPAIRRIRADLFEWRPDRRYDVVFFSFWLSHVPPARFEAFWRTVADALAPGGRFFLVDSSYEPTSTARDHRLGPPGEVTRTRRLDDGSEFRIVKVFHRAGDLEGRLAAAGWRAEARETDHYFLHAHGSLEPDGALLR